MFRFGGAIGLIAPTMETEPAQSFAFGGGEKLRRDNLVRVDVLDGQVKRARGKSTGCTHAAFSPDSLSRVLGSVMYPVTADAAAVSGLARTVRTSRPWRPLKLRLLVLTTRSPGWPISPFMPMHMEQPGSRHSAPAAR